MSTERWNALRAWLLGERINLENQTFRVLDGPEHEAKLARLRGSLQEVIMTLQRMDDIEKEVGAA